MILLKLLMQRIMIWGCKQVTDVGFWPTVHFDFDRSNSKKKRTKPRDHVKL